MAELNQRTRTIQTVTIWGAVGNLALSIFKLIAGLLGRSTAMVADAIHSFSDLVSDFVVIVFARIAGKGKDKGHDYGHGKFETLATLVVSLLLLAVGGKMIASSIIRVQTVLGGGTLEMPGLIALIAAVASIAVKEILYQWTAREGRKISSQAMIANAWHHRSDALSSVGSLIGIGGAMLLGGKWVILDPLAGGIISIVIIIVAVRMAGPALSELTDASLPDETENRISEIISSVKGVRGVHDLKSRRCGSYSIVDAHIVVDPEMTVAAAHDITEVAEDNLRKEFGEEMQITLHVEPSEDSR